MLRKMLRKTTVLCGWNGCAVRLGAMAEVPGQWADNIDRATALAMLHRSLRVAHRTDRAIWGGIASQRIMARPNRAPFVIRYSASSSGTTCSRGLPPSSEPDGLADDPIVQAIGQDGREERTDSGLPPNQIAGLWEA